MPAVTIYEVAEEAGVSIATVSKVLSNRPYVSESTRKKVLQAIDRLGYVPNPVAQSLTRGNTGIIGLLIPYAPQQLFADPHLLAIIHGVEETLNDRDYNLLLATARRPHDPASAYGRLVRSRYLDGALVLETVGSEALSPHLRQQQYPWVIIGYQLGNQPCAAVHSDDRRAARRMTEYLISLGHRRIAVVSADPRPAAFDERLRGFEEAMTASDLPIETSLQAWGDMTIESGYTIAPKLLDRSDRPTAIFALNDRMALGLLRWAAEQGITVPDQLSIVGFDDIPLAEISTPALTTVRQPALAIGQQATQLLFQILDGTAGVTTIEVPAELVIRRSAGPAAG